MPVILLTNYYSEEPLSIMKKEIPSRFDIISLDKACKQELIKKASKADYFLASGRIPIDKEVIDAAINLKMIQRTGVGIDTLDLDLLKEVGVPVYVNKGINFKSVAEHTIMLIFSVLRRLILVNSSIRMGDWFKQELGIQGSELYGKTVGLIGLGSIGIEVAKMLNAFGVKVLYYKPTRLAKDSEEELNINYRTLTELLQEVDILSLHCPLNSETEKMIGSKEIFAMKPGSIIINTSRGGLIDEKALKESLELGHIRGAGLDVFAEEPLPKNNFLLHLENVVITPHIGGITLESFTRMMREALENIKYFEDGRKEMIEYKRLQV